MNSSRPYFIRALYDWIVDNECTPYILVNAQHADVLVPKEHVKNGQIILNLSSAAVKGLTINNEAVDIDGRFAGVARRVYVPITAILGIYARENGQGMFFDSDSLVPQPPIPADSEETAALQPEPDDRRRQDSAKPQLRLVKS